MPWTAHLDLVIHELSRRGGHGNKSCCCGTKDHESRPRGSARLHFNRVEEEISRVFERSLGPPHQSLVVDYSSSHIPRCVL